MAMQCLLLGCSSPFKPCRCPDHTVQPRISHASCCKCPQTLKLTFLSGSARTAQDTPASCRGATSPGLTQKGELAAGRFCRLFLTSTRVSSSSLARCACSTASRGRLAAAWCAATTRSCTCRPRHCMVCTKCLSECRLLQESHSPAAEHEQCLERACKRADWAAEQALAALLVRRSEGSAVWARSQSKLAPSWRLGLQHAGGSLLLPALHA